MSTPRSRPPRPAPQRAFARSHWPAACAPGSTTSSSELVKSTPERRRTAMIYPSLFLRRALIADAVFSGVAALSFTFGAGPFAALFNLPEVFLREVGLFLIAYAAF